MVASTVFFSVSDVITKELAGTLPAVEVAWLRYVTFALLVVPFVVARGGIRGLRTQAPGLQALRGLGTVARRFSSRHRSPICRSPTQRRSISCRRS